MIKTALLSFSFLLIFSLSTLAQTEKGSKLLGGTASANFEKNFSGGLFPQGGYFVSNNLALGTGITLYFSKFNTEDSMGNEFRSHSPVAGVSPFVRYYLGKSSSTRLFTQAGVDFLRQWSVSRQNGGEPQRSTFNHSTLRAGVGVVHFITQQVGLEALLAYSSSKYSYSDRSGRITLNIGLQIYLPASK